MFVIYLKLYYRLLIFDVAETFPLFIPSKDEILLKKTPTFLHQKMTGWCQWAIIFCVDVHRSSLLPSPTCIHLSLTPPPFGRHKWNAPKGRRAISKGQLYYWHRSMHGASAAENF